MSAALIDGRAFAKRKNAETTRRVEAHLEQVGRAPRLDVLLVGDDPASAVYVRNKERAAAKVGIEGHVHTLDPGLSQAELAARIVELNADPTVDGLILQLPLPGNTDPSPLLAAIDPAKDVDGFHPVNTGRLLQGVAGGLVPATPRGILWILDDEEIDLRGADVCIVSHSNLIGKPLAAMLINRDATVTVCHVHTKDLAAQTRSADVLITAAGVPGLITADHVREGSTVVDAATVYGDDGVLRGDCDPTVATRAGRLTPVPGGVGPVTVAALLANTVDAWERRTGVA